MDRRRINGVYAVKSTRMLYCAIIVALSVWLFTIGEHIYRKVTALHHIQRLSGFVAAPNTLPKWVRRRVDASVAELINPVSGVFVAHTNFDDEHVPLLEPFVELHDLQLDDTRVSDIGLARLPVFEGLDSLSLSGTRVTDGGIVILRRFNRLREIDLSDTCVGDVGLQQLTALKNLVSLKLNRTHVTDVGLEYLVKLSYLQELELAETSITDAGMRSITQMTSLRRLSLGGVAVTDAGFALVHLLRQLEVLDVHDTQVSDSTMLRAFRLGHLKHLDFSGTTVSDEGVAHLTAYVQEQSRAGVPGNRTVGADESRRALPRLLLIGRTRITEVWLNRLREVIPELAVADNSHLKLERSFPITAYHGKSSQAGP